MFQLRGPVLLTNVNTKPQKNVDVLGCYFNVKGKYPVSALYDLFGVNDFDGEALSRVFWDVDGRCQSAAEHKIQFDAAIPNVEIFVYETFLEDPFESEEPIFKYETAKCVNFVGMPIGGFSMELTFQIQCVAPAVAQAPLLELQQEKIWLTCLRRQTELLDPIESGMVDLADNTDLLDESIAS